MSVISQPTFLNIGFSKLDKASTSGGTVFLESNAVTGTLLTTSGDIITVRDAAENHHTFDHFKIVTLVPGGYDNNTKTFSAFLGANMTTTTGVFDRVFDVSSFVEAVSQFPDTNAAFNIDQVATPATGYPGIKFISELIMDI